MAANCMVSPMRTELPEGATFTPFEVDSDAPTFMPPPQPDHRESANNKMTMLLNFTREDFLDPTISESPFLKIRARAKCFSEGMMAAVSTRDPFLQVHVRE
jgi:hypothetical protein